MTFSLSENEVRSIKTIHLRSIEFEEQVKIWDDVSYDDQLFVKVDRLIQGDIVVGGVHTEKPKKRARRQKREARRMR